MGEQVMGALEGALVVVGWLALYSTVVGPAVGAMVPGFDEPMQLGRNDCVEECRELPANPRGWLGLASTVVVVVGYIVATLWLTPRGGGLAPDDGVL